MSEEKVRSPYDMKAPLPYSLRVSFECNGEKVTGYVVGASLVDGTYCYDVLDSEDTLAHGTLYEKVPEIEIVEEELWKTRCLENSLERCWNPKMPWWQPDVRCAGCGCWINARTAGATESHRLWCKECMKKWMNE